MDKDKYNGPERRQEHRRKQSDRRVDIRFEPDKDSRRKSTGRRKADRDVWHQHDE